MRVGLLADVGAPGRGAEAGLARLGDAAEQGYDVVWLQDEAAGGALSAALLFVAAQLSAAERAPALGICSHPAGSIHPLRVAEELAVLDIMTGGRLEWAVSTDGVAWEVLEIVLRAWRGEPFAHEGERHSIPETTCHPVPLRDPHPAIWLSLGTSVPGSLPLEQHGHMVGMTERVRVRGDAASPHAVARLLVLDESDAAARSRAVAALERLLGRRLEHGEDVTEYAIAGDAAACREQLAGLRETHAPELLIVAPEPATDEPESLAALQRAFAEAVLGHG